jgi:hypothetical protein
LNDISSWAVGVMTKTWRELINRDGRWIRLLNRWFSPHQMDVCGFMSGMCPQISIYMPLRSDPRIGSGCQRQEVGFSIVNGGIVNKEFK